MTGRAPPRRRAGVRRRLGTSNGSAQPARRARRAAGPNSPRARAPDICKRAGLADDAEFAARPAPGPEASYAPDVTGSAGSPAAVSSASRSVSRCISRLISGETARMPTPTPIATQPTVV